MLTLMDLYDFAPGLWILFSFLGTLAIIALCSCFRYLPSNPGDVIWTAHQKPSKKNTRKEDLARFARGEIGIQEYLDLHSGTPEDGSLVREKREVQGIVDKWFYTQMPNPHFQPVVGRCPRGSHPGFRVMKDRLVRTGHNVTLWQPKSGVWLTLQTGSAYDEYPCCPGFMWFTNVNGKRLA